VLAETFGIRREKQDAFAIASHRKAIESPFPRDEIVPLEGLSRDAFPRALTETLCARLPPIAGDQAFGVTRATVAVEADAAAALLVVSETMLRRLNVACSLRIVAATRSGDDPAMPGVAPIVAARKLLAAHRIRCRDDRGSRNHGSLRCAGHRLCGGNRGSVIGAQSGWWCAGAGPSDRRIRCNPCRTVVA